MVCGSRRRGVSLMEMIAATALFSVVVALVVPIVAGVAAVREEAAMHQLAVSEVSNLMERIAAIRMGHALTDADLADVALSEAAAVQLPEPDLRVELLPPAGTPAERRLTVSLSWVNAAGERGAPVSLTTFLYEEPPTP